jgi:hypothetical protein
MNDSTKLPAAVRKSDGRIEPFDGDRISRHLFIAAERLGQADPLLCRELADGVLHFLAAVHDGDVIPIADLRDTVVKVVRELGHPRLALTFADPLSHRAKHPGVDLPEEMSLPPDVAAAKDAGLLLFSDWENSVALAGVVVKPSMDVRELFAATPPSRLFVIDSPDYLLRSSAEATDWGRRLAAESSTPIVVNLNASRPPTWAIAPEGPLFGQTESADSERLRQVVSDALLRSLLENPGLVRVDWHLGERDFGPADQRRLLTASRYVADGSPMAFVIDRPQQPIALAEGIDRDHPVLFAAIGIALTRLLEIVRGPVFPWPASEAEKSSFLAKLNSLSGLALSAGRTRRQQLRTTCNSSDLILSRARFLGVPLGLNPVVEAITGEPAAGGDGPDLARAILLGLNTALAADAGRLPVVVDGPSWRAGFGEEGDVRPDSGDRQLRAAALLQTAMGGGTAVIDLSQGRRPTADGIASLVQLAWQQSGLGRFVFHFSAH